MGWLIWIVLGLVAGIIAKMIMPGRDPGGFIVTALIGVAGSFVAAYFGKTMGLYLAGSAPGFIASVMCAKLLLFVYRLVKRRTA